MKHSFRTTSRAAAVAALATVLLLSCSAPAEIPTGRSEPDLGWLFTGRGPYRLHVPVQAAPGEASFCLVSDRSLMADEPEIVFARTVTVRPDSTIDVRLGRLAPGFYEVRLRDSIRWNIGVRPDAVVSLPDAQADFDEFWAGTLSELANIPLEPVFTEIPAYSNGIRTCYEVRYASWNGGVSGGILSVPVAPGKYPVCIQYMGYGAEPYYSEGSK